MRPEDVPGRVFEPPFPESRFGNGAFSAESDDNETTPRYQIIPASELSNLPQGSPLISGVLDQNSLSMVCGQPGTGKSFVSLDMSLRISSGQTDFLGREICAHGPVVYVIGEGLRGVHKRVEAWKSSNAPADESNLFVLPEPVEFFEKSGKAVKCFSESLKRDLDKPPILIVLDTLFTCYAGGDLLDASDMTSFVNGCRRIMFDHECAVLLVHHPAKNADSNALGGFGSQALTAACDTIIKVSKKGDGGIHLRTEKQKDGDLVELAAKLMPVPFCESAVLIDGGLEAENGLFEESPDSAIVRAAFTTYGVDTDIPKAELKELFYEASGYRRTSFYKAFQHLKTAGHLIDLGSKCSLTEAGAAAYDWGVRL